MDFGDIIVTYVIKWGGQFSRRDLNKERAPEPQGWLVARVFQDQSAALRAFLQARDLLLSEDLDASVLRFTLDGRSHVALLGEEPLPEQSREKIQVAISAESKSAGLPEAVADHLRSRRRQFKATGLNFLERRTRIGPDDPR